MTEDRALDWGLQSVDNWHMAHLAGQDAKGIRNCGAHMKLHGMIIDD
jgi:hypothetical protein